MSSDVRTLLGVMSAPVPASVRMRTQWRQWASMFNETGHTVDVRFVVGSSAYVHGRTPRHRQEPPAAVSVEHGTHDDFVVVDGREKLPHVGKVTEKSAAWWLNIEKEQPGYAFYCKCDDDTLVHLDRLHQMLNFVQRARGADAAVYLGHIKWRGWDVGHRFQACGGGWGPAKKTGDDIAYGGDLPDGKRYPPCPHAAGPYPYMSGGMVCMSRRMVRILAADAAFIDFVSAARRRNTGGTACSFPVQCAAQPVATHMWHHEDAGIGFNVFRAVAAANATVSIVPVPGHYNDAGVIERTSSAHDRYWSTRAIFVHGIKETAQFTSALKRWTLQRPTAHLSLRCFPCTAGGTNGHNGDWQWSPEAHTMHAFAYAHALHALIGTCVVCTAGGRGCHVQRV